MSLKLDEFKKFTGQVIELGEKINSSEGEVKYALKRDIRKAAQGAKNEAQKIRIAVQSLGQKTEKAK